MPDLIEKLVEREYAYWAAPKSKGPALQSLDEVDPEIRATFNKLGISLAEQERVSGCRRNESRDANHV